MSLREITVKIAAGGSDELAFKGNYLRAKVAPYTLTIENMDSGGRDVFGLQEGEDALFTVDFERLRITNTGGGDAFFTFVIGQNAKVSSAKISGSLQISSQRPAQATGFNEQKTVTNASGLLLAENSNRQYLLIQNKDATGNIYVNFGATATIANGLQIEPLGSFELNSNILTAAIYAIGDIASNANVVIVSA